MISDLNSFGDVYIGRQPIIDANNHIVAYEILYRSTETKNFCEEDLDNFSMTSYVLSIILNNIGVDKLVGDKKGLINVNETILNSEIVKNIPKEKFYLEILETTDINDAIIEKIDELINDGYTFVLDDFTLSKDNLEKYRMIFPRIKYVKADLKENSMENMKSIINMLKKLPVEFLAEKVETQEEFEKLKKMGYTLFQGYFYSRPAILSAKKITPSKIAVVHVLSMIYNNSDLKMIIKRFEDYPIMSINLLKFLNSAFFSFKKDITSIKQAITLLGLNKLKNWLILLLYTNDGNDPYSNPLFVMIKNRSVFMMKILGFMGVDDEQTKETVYLTGLLSKIDMVLASKMEEALESLHMDASIKKAILKKEGLAGEILTLAEANETNDFEKINLFLEKYSLSLSHITEANLSSYNLKILK